MESLQELFENAHSIIYTNLRDSIKRYTNLNLFHTELKIKLKNVIKKIIYLFINS